MAEKFAEIHVWMFNKIKLQNQFSEEVITQLTQSPQSTQIQKKLEEFFPFPKGNLEKIIDHENIHQWLEKYLILTDRKLAWLIHQVKDNLLTSSELEDLFFQLGKKHREVFSPVWLKPSYVYRTITDALTEGMPCDKANQVLSHDENHLAWEVSRCMHSDNWSSENANVDDFYALRDAWTRGLLDGSGFTYTGNHPKYKIDRN
jgi:hypothetical protein